MVTTHLHRSCASPRKGLIHRIFLALARHRTRHDLRALDDHMLQDIGLTRTEALAEANRPIWDAPASWIKK
jgi:uncharacterized protein YjiS (DUF1127 family)